ncbi:hypothetical protein [Sunxiuqinia sp. sy24]
MASLGNQRTNKEEKEGEKAIDTIEKNVAQSYRFLNVSDLKVCDFLTKLK